MFTEKDFFGTNSMDSLVKDVSTIEFNEKDTMEEMGVTNSFNKFIKI